MPIPILRLPYLALKEVLCCADNFELLKLSVCSQKSAKAVKICTKDRASIFKLENADFNSFNELEKLQLFLQENPLNYESLREVPSLTVNVAYEHSLTVKWSYNFSRLSMQFESLCKINRYTGVHKNLRFGETLVPVIMTNGNKVYSFWRDKSDGLLCLMNFFKNSFKLEIEDLNIDGGNHRDFSSELRKVVTYVSAGPIYNVDVKGRLRAEDYRFVLENVKANFLDIRVKQLRNFKFNREIQAEHIFIADEWFTPQHLLSATSYKSITIENSKFTNKDCRILLENWLEGKYPNLTDVELSMVKDLNGDTLFEGFQVETRLQSVWGTRWDYRTRWDREIPVIIRHDGAKADVLKYDREFQVAFKY